MSSFLPVQLVGLLQIASLEGRVALLLLSFQRLCFLRMVRMSTSYLKGPNIATKCKL